MYALNTCSRRLAAHKPRSIMPSLRRTLKRKSSQKPNNKKKTTKMPKQLKLGDYEQQLTRTEKKMTNKIAVPTVQINRILRAVPRQIATNKAITPRIP